MPTEEKTLKPKHVAVRLDDATVVRLDALLPLYALPGRAATRSDGLRAVILAGLDVEEGRAAGRGSLERRVDVGRTAKKGGTS